MPNVLKSTEFATRDLNALAARDDVALSFSANALRKLKTLLPDITVETIRQTLTWSIADAPSEIEPDQRHFSLQVRGLASCNSDRELVSVVVPMAEINTIRIKKLMWRDERSTVSGTLAGASDD